MPYKYEFCKNAFGGGYMARLSTSPLIAVAKKAGVERIDGEAKAAIADVVESFLSGKFAKAASALNASGKKTLGLELLKALF
jgi:histone H3/H4